MIIAITGGTGFIGRRLVLRHLECGNEVRVFSRRSSRGAGLPDSVKWWMGNLTNSSNMLSFVDGADVLYHCAAENFDNSKMFATNVDGTRNLIRVAGGKIRHWVQLSSVGVYGTHADGVITEKTPLSPINIYEESKATAENNVIGAAISNNFSYTILRPSNVYGLGMHQRGLLRMISLLDKKAFFFIGKPGASANYIHVDDVVEALVRCGSMPSAKNRIYNLSDYRTIEDFIAIISRALHKPVPRLRIPESWARVVARMTVFIPNNPLTEQRVSALVTRAIYSSVKIKCELGNWHFVCAEDGLRELVEYMKQNR